MAPRGRIAIQPQIALFTAVLTATCAYAAYTEKYIRNQDQIDDELQGKYYADMKDAQAKIPQMTQTIRGKDMSLDPRMNKLVWGGKANLQTPKPSSSSGSSSSSSSDPADDWDDSDDDDYNDYSSSGSDSDSSSSGSSSSSSEDEDGSLSSEEGARMRERKKRRKARKRKNREKRERRRIKKKQGGDEAAAAEKKLMMQSMAAGVTFGALAMAAAFLTTRRK